MIKQTQKYSQFFASLLSVAAAVLFAWAEIVRFNEPNNVYAALGFWLLAASLVLWLIYLVVNIGTKTSKN